MSPVDVPIHLIISDILTGTRLLHPRIPLGGEETTGLEPAQHSGARAGQGGDEPFPYSQLAAPCQHMSHQCLFQLKTPRFPRHRQIPGPEGWLIPLGDGPRICNSRTAHPGTSPLHPSPLPGASEELVKLSCGRARGAGVAPAWPCLGTVPARLMMTDSPA